MKGGEDAVGGKWWEDDFAGDETVWLSSFIHSLKPWAVGYNDLSSCQRLHLLSTTTPWEKHLTGSSD